MSQLPRYESYKDSGVQWLGEIPSHWDVKRMKFVVANVGDKIDAKESDLRYFGLENIESFTGKLLDSVELESEGIGHRFQKDDVLFGKLRPYLAKVFLAQEEGLSSTEALVFRSSEVIYPKFLSYYCLSQDFINEVNGTTFGSKMPRASWDDISSFRMVYPSLDEQKIIADFLDKRLAQVDALIAKQETLLEKLAEQRVALISHAVTKGLNPHVEMKESKIRWVKDIPIHWNVVPVRYLFEFKNNQRIPVSAEDRGKMSEKIYPYYGASGIIDFVEDYIFDEDLLLVAEDGANLLSRSTPLAFKASGKYWVNNHAHIIKPVDNNLTYWEYVLALYDFTPLISGSAQPKLTKDNLASIKLPNPPDKEKHEICNFLDKPLENLKEQKLKIEKILETLKEYRSTLITQVVTGKIDVRNLKVN